MISKAFWRYIVPAMWRIPILSKLGEYLLLIRLMKIYKLSTEAHHEVLVSEFWNKAPFDQLRPYAALLALTPALMILQFYIMKAIQQTTRR